MHRNTKLYCNPLPLPDYPRGNETYDKDEAHMNGALARWIKPGFPDFRETADPSVLYYEGKWYLYPSCAMAYVSEDFVNWEHHPIEPFNLGYAPTICLHKGKFYITACDTGLYVSDSPLGPFTSLGRFTEPDGTTVSPFLDPMLFSDDDGRMYVYWGLSDPGIFGAALDENDPTRLATKPNLLFSYDPSHEWERFGDYNEDASQNFNEGPWMFKHESKYFLTYAAPGTQWKTYGMGTYVGDSPLGPFRYQERNPILRDTQGIVHGPGHGCIVEGPNNTIWAFYTCLVRNNHIFERRVGMDPAGFDEAGNLFVLGASESPQLAPGAVDHPERGNSAGLFPVSVNKRVIASSSRDGRDPYYVNDESMRTWWMPEANDETPHITIKLEGFFIISSVRLLWRDEGLDYENGVLPGPLQFHIEARKQDGTWVSAVDMRENKTDMLIDFIEFEPIEANEVRITITGTPKGISPALIQLTVFGKQST